MLETHSERACRYREDFYRQTPVTSEMYCMERCAYSEATLGWSCLEVACPTKVMPTNIVLVNLVDRTGLFIGVFRPSGLTNTLAQLPMNDMLHCKRLLVYSIWLLSRLGAWVINDVQCHQTLQPCCAYLDIEPPEGSCRNGLYQDWQMCVVNSLSL